jgi:hypothetical protein
VLEEERILAGARVEEVVAGRGAVFVRLGNRPVAVVDDLLATGAGEIDGAADRVGAVSQESLLSGLRIELEEWSPKSGSGTEWCQDIEKLVSVRSCFDEKRGRCSTGNKGLLFLKLRAWADTELVEWFSGVEASGLRSRAHVVLFVTDLHDVFINLGRVGWVARFGGAAAPGSEQDQQQPGQ